MEIINKIRMKDDFYINPAVTICFIGDSVTHGCFECYVNNDGLVDTIFELGSSYTNHVKEILNKLYPRSQVNIISSGLSGDSASNGVKRYERDVLRYHPDLVVISYGLNDAVCTGEKGIKDYTDAIEKMIKDAKQIGSEVLFMTQNYMATEISSFLPKEKAMVDVANSCISVQTSGLLEKYFDAAKKTCAKNNVKVVDMYSVWNTLYKNGVKTTELLANKINHPIREFHYYMGVKIVEKMFEE